MTRRPLVQAGWAVKWDHFGFSRTFHVRSEARDWRAELGLAGRVVRVTITEALPKRKAAKKK